MVIAFFTAGFINLKINGVAAAPAVAMTAIANVVDAWFVEGRNFSAGVVGSYNVIQVLPSALS